MRQQLHHFSRRSTKLQPHPFNQQDFEPLADLTRFVAKLCLELERKALDREVGLGAQSGAAEGENS
jgi:hypothetical protein